ncbi:GAF domain-containing protein [Oculatella sp. LEGE 06141]|uniref:sensor histidine kinase n=1 Tax=Oculatella sp. LEGE 06141 TaxID=1828648 RepID=UPI00187DF5E3|nr:GAF domain-containing sensor histidine kinase [Oculatella sp. LEGE 06141]MBE9182642.1 GAF domain-containing protein [Oculatella sp. LEGE 06141]
MNFDDQLTWLYGSAEPQSVPRFHHLLERVSCEVAAESMYKLPPEPQSSLYLQLSLNGTILAIEPSNVSSFSNHPTDDRVGTPVFTLVHPDDRDTLKHALDTVAKQPTWQISQPLRCGTPQQHQMQQATVSAHPQQGLLLWIRPFHPLAESDRPLRAKPETALKRVNQALEDNLDRTSALRWAIAQLQAEVIERHRIERSLREQEQLLRSIYNGIEEPIFVVDITEPQQFRYVASNAAHERLTGLSTEDLCNKTPDQIFSPDAAVAVRQHYEDCVQAGDSITYEECLPFDQRQTWWFTTLHPLRDRHNRIHRIIGTSINITERKQAEKALQQQVERERLVGDITQRIRQSLDMEAVLNTTVAEVRQFLQADRTLILRIEPDLSGTVVVESVTPEWAPLLGTQIHGACFIEAFDWLNQEGQVQAIDDILQASLTVEQLNGFNQLQVRAALIVPILQTNQLWGLLVTHQCSGAKHWQSPEIELLQQLAAQVGIAIQQSELYQQVQQFNSLLESQVQERTQQLEQALAFEAVLQRVTEKVRDSLDETLIVQTAVQELAQILQVRYCNAAYHSPDLSQVGILYETSVVPFKSQVPLLPVPEFLQVYQQIHQGDCTQFCTAIAASTPERFVLLICPIIDEQGVLSDLLLLDQRDRAFSTLEIHLVKQVANQCAIAIRQARLYQAVQTQVEELERLNHSKDDFLNTVSHELRSPVANMTMALQMLELSLRQTHLPDAAAVMLDHENAPQTHKISLYLQILGNECKRETDLINDLLDLQRLEVGKQSLSITEIPLQTWLPKIVQPFVERANARQQTLQVELPSYLPAILSDAAALERIIAELLTNACKYTPPGEYISVVIALEPDELVLKVVNFGVEIPAHELLRIFDKFYRIPNIDAWRQGGTGLGLALIKKLIEHLGGSIAVESAADRTCFTVQIPLLNDRQTNLLN